MTIEAPHDLDAEQALLAALVEDSTLALESMNGDTPSVEDFYSPIHQNVYAALTWLHAHGAPTDAVSLADRIRTAGSWEAVGQSAGLLKAITTHIPAPAAAHRYAGIVCARARERRLQVAGDTAARLAHAGDADGAAKIFAAELERDRSKAAGATRHLQSGGDWLLDAPSGIPAMWGADDDVLWAEGESLLLCGGTGAGKTTIAAQLLMAMLDLGGPVLGLPVRPVEGRALYLAMDRPAQARRAIGRLIEADYRDTLNDRLAFWPGPPLRDFGKDPGELLAMCRQADAEVVFVDSAKDAAMGLSEDQPGAGFNRAVQTALSEGVQVIVLHHQRKAGTDGRKPTTLDDVYGSTWLTAGAGSVVLLWGKPGDALVELSHLKQPGAVVGPLKVEHDHSTGRSSVVEPFDPLTWLRGQPRGGTAADAARVLYDRDPTENEIRSVRRRLDKLSDDGHARKVDAIQGGPTGTQPARWYPLETTREEQW